MRVLVTGGTGFVGSHSVQALMSAGHEVRLLVRDPARIAPALEPLGITTPPEHAVGDVTDAASVKAALDGCDAVLHAANVYALNAKQAREMLKVNPTSTELVLGAAHELGLDPIIHVSSFVALLPPQNGRVLTRDSPVGSPAGPYARSKAAAEAIARHFQDEGAPVVITYPGAVWGPHDPYLGESSTIALDIARHRLPVVPPGPMSVVDVRDVAAVHAALMRPAGGTRRALIVERDVPFSELFSIVRRVTGRRVPALPLPRALMAPTVGRLGKVPPPMEGLWFTQQDYATDAGALTAETGVELRPAAQSVEDTLRWLVEAGHLAGRG